MANIIKAVSHILWLLIPVGINIGWLSLVYYGQDNTLRMDVIILFTIIIYSGIVKKNEGVLI